MGGGSTGRGQADAKSCAASFHSAGRGAAALLGIAIHRSGKEAHGQGACPCPNPPAQAFLSGDRPWPRAEAPGAARGPAPGPCTAFIALRVRFNTVPILPRRTGVWVESYQTTQTSMPTPGHEATTTRQTSYFGVRALGRVPKREVSLVKCFSTMSWWRGEGGTSAISCMVWGEGGRVGNRDRRPVPEFGANDLAEAQLLMLWIPGQPPATQAASQALHEKPGRPALKVRASETRCSSKKRWNRPGGWIMIWCMV